MLDSWTVDPGALVDRTAGERYFPLCDSCSLPHVVHATQATYNLLRFWGFALHGRGCRGYPGHPYEEGRGVPSLFPPALIHCSEYLRTPQTLWSPIGTGPGQSANSGLIVHARFITAWFNEGAAGTRRRRPSLSHRLSPVPAAL